MWVHIVSPSDENVNYTKRNQADQTRKIDPDIKPCPEDARNEYSIDLLLDTRDGKDNQRNSISAPSSGRRTCFDPGTKALKL